MRGFSSFTAWPFSLRMTCRLAILVLVVLEFARVATGAMAVGPPLLPDLVTSPPSGLYIERGPDGHYLLRFANTAVNMGGRLEIQVGSGTRDIYQNIYDSYVGGNLVIHKRVGADLIYHPQHSHFHFEDFAKYELLKKSSAGYYQSMNRDGSKTTFCILDSIRVGTNGPVNRGYDGCGARVQGLSAGWGDTYIASLFGQWIDLGTTPPADGSYAIRSTADPDNKLMELNDFNNVGLKYFTIRNGRLSTDLAPPLCSLESSTGLTSVNGGVDATVGSTVQINCLRFGDREQVNIYWGSVNTKPRASVTSTSGGAVTAQFQVPQSSLGVHYVIARGETSGIQVAAVVNTIPSVSVSPKQGVVGAQVTVTLRGYSASEEVDVRFYKTANTNSSVARVAVGSNGSGSATFNVPVTPYGSHSIAGIGVSSGVKAWSSLVVGPSIASVPDEVQAGDPFGIALRGFTAGETIQVTLGEGGRSIGAVVASHSGSTTPTTGQVIMPSNVTPGDHVLWIVGDRSRSPVQAQIAVTAPGVSEEPPPTPTIEPTLTATPTETAEPTQTAPPPTETGTPDVTPEPTATETETPTPVPNASPVAQAPPDLTVVDDDGDGSQRVSLDGTASSDPDGDALSYAWTAPDEQAPSNNAATPSETLLSTEAVADLTLPVGEHTITLTVTDPFGANATDVVIVIIEPTPEPADG